MNNPVMLTENALRIVAKDIERFYKKNAQNKDWCIDTCQNAADQFESFRKRVSELQAQLAEAQRRAEKAVADLKYIAVCETCKKSGVTGYPESAVIQCEYYDSECGCGKYEWRGDAEEGEK